MKQAKPPGVVIKPRIRLSALPQKDKILAMRNMEPVEMNAAMDAIKYPHRLKLRETDATKT